MEIDGISSFFYMLLMLAAFGLIALLVCACFGIDALLHHVRWVS